MEITPKSESICKSQANPSFQVGRSQIGGEKLNFEDSVMDWACEYPELIPVFEKHGIQYCCGGKSLAYVCQREGYDPNDILAHVPQAIPSTARKPSGESRE